jgi:hypothetical protein
MRLSTELPVPTHRDRMALQTNCPHCQSPLLLPDNCGGQTTRCPSCLKTFVIPGAAPVVAAPPTADVAPPPEVQLTEADLKRAQARFDELTAENVGMQVELSRRERLRNRRAVQTKWLRRFLAGRKKLDQSIGRIGGFFVTLVLAASLAMVLFSVFGLSAFGYFVVVTFTLIAAGVAYIPFSFYPDDVQLAQLLPREEERLAEVTASHEQLAMTEAAQRQHLIAAEEEFKRIRAAVSSRLAWLRNCRWQQMNGKTLVTFLEQVFQEHGYTVESTGKMGQTGIDLVVVRDGARVAVQVKGLQASTVDAAVVQQTDAGRGRFQCRRAAVITNAQFLPSARQLADKLGVRLVDAGEIPDLIEGRIEV